MSYTELLLEQMPTRLLSEVSSQLEPKLAVNDLLKSIAKETFNVTMPVLQVKNEIDFKKAVRFAISAKYLTGKDLITLGDLTQMASDVFADKLMNKLVRAAKSMGTHVHKMTSTCIDDSANYFNELPKIHSGINSSNLSCERQITGSKDGVLVAAYGFLSACHKIANGEATSLFDRIVNREPLVIKLLSELSQNTQFVEDLACAAAEHKKENAAKKVSQFHKQSFINYSGQRITVTPLQSVLTTVALKKAIDNIYQQKGRINIKRYAAGGNNNQNVSALNQDLGGSIPHIKAWIPSQKKQHDAFYYLYRTRRLTLSKPQKELIATLAWSIGRIENKKNINQHDKKINDNIFSKLANILRIDLEAFAFEINQLDETKVNDIKSSLNPMIKNYFSATTIQEKTESSEDLALKIVALASAEMKRHKLNIQIEDSAFDTATKVFEKGDVLCRLL